MDESSEGQEQFEVSERDLRPDGGLSRMMMMIMIIMKPVVLGRLPSWQRQEKVVRGM